MVGLKTRFENFDFLVWIKHPLFQEQALIPVVGCFQWSNTHKFTWFGNLPTPRSYCFVLIKLKNYTNKGGGHKTLSTQLYSLKLSLFFSETLLLSVFFTLLHTALHKAHRYTKWGWGGINHAMIYARRLCPPPCAKWEIRYFYLHMVRHGLSPLTNIASAREKVPAVVNMN